MDRRNFFKLAAVGGGVVFMSGLYNSVQAYTGSDFYFVQLSDVHWGYAGDANPEAKNTLRKAVESVNALPLQPDFIVFTGDLTHTTDDPVERRRRMAEFKEIIGGLKVRNIHFLPGEHDASLDAGAAFKEYFGVTSYAFDHKGVHFIALDNVSDSGARLGEKQLAWLEADLAKQAKDAPIVVLTHRPLFDLAPKWDWATRDGAQAIALLMPYTNVTVFYGHIHQEHHHMSGHIPHHAAKSLIFPLPAPGSQDKRTPLPWNADKPFQGLGFREIDVDGKTSSMVEFPVAKA
ncbi:metallophosphoesterase [Undibacterium sp. TS12]|uniref:metallophosphoesterase family protein n=1 Tax=Undibacterium sp. TS12 TaxID=2908202 RepID=UPI001F4CA604|nr:metallophosphoesterase [Undibacterium sp. TS12]MCH8617603.1 metallophosphoesterase [Undibacterium sp. TS12]